MEKIQDLLGKIDSVLFESGAKEVEVRNLTKTEAKEVFERYIGIGKYDLKRFRSIDATDLDTNKNYALHIRSL